MRRLLRGYVLWTYGVFFLFILLIGMTMLVLESLVLAEVLKVVSAWTATFVFVAMFRKIYPEDNLISYVKRQFSERMKLSTVVWVLLLQSSIFIGILLMTSVIQGVPLSALVTTSWITLLLIFGNNLIRGPLGEQIGWRAFVLNELQKSYSPLKSAVIVGVLWGFWHAPLWFLSGYAGMQLVQYIGCFMIYIISTSIIMTVFYNLNRNLLIPIIIHQLANYFVAIQIGDVLNIITITTVFYLVAALILVLVNHKNCLYGKAPSGDSDGISA
ncbi:MAG: CPBP family intramembrane metalloprotease [Firmicutes bacterium]|nr:CPBP family intramembrane metalloprotease [Bacillota bacterium]